MSIELTGGRWVQDGLIRSRGERSAGRCGTYPGYAAHLRNEDEICDPCRTAMREYKRELRARKQAS